MIEEIKEAIEKAIPDAITERIADSNAIFRFLKVSNLIILGYILVKNKI